MNYFASLLIFSEYLFTTEVDVLSVSGEENILMLNY